MVGSELRICATVWMVGSVNFAGPYWLRAVMLAWAGVLLVMSFVPRMR